MLPVLFTTSVKLTLVFGEPKVGLAVLVMVILGSDAFTIAVSLFVTLLPDSGLPSTFTRLVKVLVPEIGPLILALIHNSLLASGSIEPISDQFIC